MGHQLPAMLSNRVFPVLILTAKRGKHAFVVVQIPVDITGLTVAMYSNGRNVQEGDSAVKRKKPVLGYECQNYIPMHGSNADNAPVSIQALRAARCSQTRTLNG